MTQELHRRTEHQNESFSGHDIKYVILVCMAGRKNTDEDVLVRLAAVESVLMSGEYNRSAQMRLSAQYSVTPRQIQRDAALIRQQWTEEVAETDSKAGKADWLQRVRSAQVRSFDSGHSMAAARLLQLEGQALGVYEPAKMDINHNVHTIDDAPRLAAELLQAIPAACDVLGVPVPQLPVIDIEEVE